MLSVSPRFNDGLVMLFSTPTGAAILEAAAVAATLGVETPVIPKGAYAETISADRINLTMTDIPAPNQACVLGHELTHCLDLAFWNIRKDAITEEQLGATEINAHYNQGLIAKELSIIPGLSGFFQQQVAAMTGSGSTFGQLYDTWDRMDVYAYLRTTQQYGPKVEKLRQNKILYLWTKDSQWERGTAMFHCEAHLAANMPHDLAW